MTIRAKFATGLICILVVNLMAGLYAFGLYQRANSQAAEVREASSQIVATALSTQVRFKKQVQEWKNILLRGQDPALFDQYLAQFEKEEQNTRASMQRLIELLGENLAARETAGQFLEAHTQLGEEYRRPWVSIGSGTRGRLWGSMSGCGASIDSPRTCWTRLSRRPGPTRTRLWPTLTSVSPGWSATSS
jgi:hypothetical protein